MRCKDRTEESAVMTYIPITLSEVTTVYSGRDRTCMCGCAGNYWYAPGTEQQQRARLRWWICCVRASRRSRRRFGRLGYNPDPEQFSARQITRIVNKINSLPNHTDHREWVEATEGQRLYVAYRNL